jgi:hypothetical protein
MNVWNPSIKRPFVGATQRFESGNEYAILSLDEETWSADLIGVIADTTFTLTYVSGAGRWNAPTRNIKDIDVLLTVLPIGVTIYFDGALQTRFEWAHTPPETPQPHWSGVVGPVAVTAFDAGLHATEDFEEAAKGTYRLLDEHRPQEQAAAPRARPSALRLRGGSMRSRRWS